MIPIMKSNPTKTVSLPNLSGGVNFRDGVSDVQDNQLTDCKNVWFNDGVLKTRSALVDRAVPLYYGIKKEENTLGFNKNVPKFHDIFKTDNDGKIKQLVSVLCRESISGGSSSTYLKMFFVYKCPQGIGDNSFVSIGNITVGNLNYADEEVNYFFFNHENNIYLFLCVQNITFKIYKLTESNSVYSWTEISDSDFYVPTVITNALPSGTKQVIDNGFNYGGNATMLEGYNALSPYYKIYYSQYNSKISLYNATHLEKAHKVSGYQLPEKIPRTDDYFDGKKITATLTSFSKVSTHEVTIPNCINGERIAIFGENEILDDGIRMRVSVSDKGNCNIYFESLQGNEYAEYDVVESQYILNNLVFTAPRKISDREKARTFNMQYSTWFGGASSGISGGTRLFLGGNRTDEYKSLVVWSDLNNPLYFPENNYFYVGNNGSAVTGFGKQNDMLVIFKQNEIFATQYTQGETPTAEKVINQDVVDITASSAYFPLIQLHSGIGCDIPNSIQLCRNRLVWANKNGKVFTMVSQSQYSERNVFDISEMFGNRITFSDDACSVDYDGHYYLFDGNKAYIMDYNSYGYVYVASYSKSDDANLRIPWYIWDFDKFGTLYESGFKSVSVLNDKMVMLRNDYIRFINPEYPAFTATIGISVISDLTDKKITDGMLVYSYDFKAEANPLTYDVIDSNISVMLKTKVFDFGLPHTNKNVYEINFSFGDNGGNPIRVSFMTESADAVNEDFITPISYGAENYSSRFLQAIRCNPGLRGNTRFGIILEGDGAFFLDKIGIYYSITGGAR